MAPVLKEEHNRLDDILAVGYRQIEQRTRSWVPSWRAFTRPLRELGERKVDANEVFERTGNVLKLVGDQYLARADRQFADRFHLRRATTSRCAATRCAGRTGRSA